MANVMKNILYYSIQQILPKSCIHLTCKKKMDFLPIGGSKSI